LIAVACFVWGISGEYVPEGGARNALRGLGLVGFALLGLGIAAIRNAKAFGYAISILLALPLAALLAFAGQALHVHNYEARLWGYTQGRETADNWSGYLSAIGSEHPALAATRKRDELLAKVERLLQALPGESDGRRAIYSLRAQLEAAGRGGYGEQSWWLDKFTPARAHFAEAARRYGEARFREVMQKKNTADLRAYRLEFAGVHAEETAAALREKYAAARTRYDAMIERKQTNAQAVAGIRALLATQAVDSFVVPVIFQPVAGLEAAEMEALVKKLGVREVHPVAPSFTAERNAGRYDAILYSMNKALEPVVGDLFSLSRIAVDEESDRFIVEQRVFPSGELYVRVADRDKPLSEQSVSIGVAMAFDTAIEARGQPKHRFSQIVKPAERLRSVGSEGGQIYHAMASSAFDDFTAALLRAYGF
jgi:hypothetical protein